MCRVPVAAGAKPIRAAENRPDSMRLVGRFMMFMMNNRDSSYLSLPEEQGGQQRHLVNNCWHHSSLTLITGAWIDGLQVSSAGFWDSREKTQESPALYQLKFIYGETGAVVAATSTPLKENTRRNIT